MKEAILAKVEESFKKAEAFYGKTFSRPTEFIWKRNGTTAGYCYHSPSKKTLMFQLDIAEANEEDFLVNTVPHEVAHYIQFEQYGYKQTPHGKFWKYVMRYVMGISPERCHSYDTSNIKKRTITRVQYDCSCRSRMYTMTKHNRIVKGRKSYVCLICRTPVKLSEKAVLPVKKVSAKEELKQLQAQLDALKTLQETLLKNGYVLPTTPNH